MRAPLLETLASLNLREVSIDWIHVLGLDPSGGIGLCTPTRQAQSMNGGGQVISLLHPSSHRLAYLMYSHIYSLIDRISLFEGAKNVAAESGDITRICRGRCLVAVKAVRCRFQLAAHNARATACPYRLRDVPQFRF